MGRKDDTPPRKWIGVEGSRGTREICRRSWSIEKVLPCHAFSSTADTEVKFEWYAIQHFNQWIKSSKPSFGQGCDEFSNKHPRLMGVWSGQHLLILILKYIHWLLLIEIHQNGAPLKRTHVCIFFHGKRPKRPHVRTLKQNKGASCMNTWSFRVTYSSSIHHLGGRQGAIFRKPLKWQSYVLNIFRKERIIYISFFLWQYSDESWLAP